MVTHESSFILHKHLCRLIHSDCREPTLTVILLSCITCAHTHTFSHRHTYCMCTHITTQKHTQTHTCMHTYIHTQALCYRYTQIQRTQAEDNKLCIKLSSNLTPILMSNYRIRAIFYVGRTDILQRGTQTCLLTHTHTHTQACTHAQAQCL